MSSIIVLSLLLFFRSSATQYVDASSLLPTSFMSSISIADSISFAKVSWVHLDGDTCADLFLERSAVVDLGYGPPTLTGKNGTWFLRSNCSGGMEDFSPILPKEIYGPGSYIVDDFDNDLKEDVIVFGNDTQGSAYFITQLASSFSLSTMQSVQSCRTFIDATSADFNGDGLKDIFVAANAPFNCSGAYANSGSALFFTDLSSQVPSCFVAPNFARVRALDFNNDGKMDLMSTSLCSSGSNILIRNVRQNGTVGFFIEDATNLLPLAAQAALAYGSISVIDYDNDAWPDLLLCGETTSAPITLRSFLLRNLGNDSGFEDVTLSAFSTALDNFTDSAIAVADIDGDGYQDFVIAGASQTASRKVVLYKYNQTLKQFEDRTNLLPGVVPVYRASASFGDANNDGRPDLFLAGQGFSAPSAQLFLNNFTFSTSSPTPSPGLPYQLNSTGPLTFNQTSPIILPSNESISVVIVDRTLLDISVSSAATAPIQATGCIALNGSLHLILNSSQTPNAITKYLVVSSPCVTGTFANITAQIISSEGVTLCVVSLSQDLSTPLSRGFVVLFDPTTLKQDGCKGSPPSKSKMKIVIVCVVAGVLILAALLGAVLYWGCYRNPNRPRLLRKFFRDEDWNVNM